MERSLIYSMTVSLDGFIAGPDGEIDWSAPDDELHRFHNEQVRELGVHLCGRKLYETMVYWETAEQDPALSAVAREFAAIWKPLQKIVFSNTLTSVEGNSRLATDSLAEEVGQLKRQPGKDLAVGGAGLASSLIEQGLIDDFRLFVSPVLLGAGTPYFPASAPRTNLRLVETRTFASRVVFLHYVREQQEGQTG
ncbi:MAG: dihydrofolate reductase family protein [Solirubrobacteraceae bacterium]